MIDTNIAKRSLLYAAAAVLYVVLVATLMSNAERIFGQQEESVLAPILFLMLFVVSAATMGMLVFGKPVMLYIDGKKREGVTMVIYTISLMAAFTAALFVVIAMSQ